jgi:hypothetical protein
VLDALQGLPAHPGKELVGRPAVTITDFLEHFASMLASIAVIATAAREITRQRRRRNRDDDQGGELEP